MKIRQALPEDASAIAPILLLAMEAIFRHFTGSDSTEKITLFLAELIAKPGNQYSYENCWVVEVNHTISGVACVYDGALLHKLRAPVATAISSTFGRVFSPENETESGEIYIDSVGVSPHFQGRGIGLKLFHFLITEYVEKQQRKLGLLVEKNNSKAKRLYLKLGFQTVGKKVLTGKTLEHLQFIPK